MTQTTKLFLSLIFMWLITAIEATAQHRDTIADTVPLEVIALADRYLLTDTLTLSISNNHTEVIYFAIGINENIGGEWMPLVYDIFRHSRDRYKARNIGAILPGERKMIPVTFAKYFTAQSKPTGLCRFIIEVRKEPLNEGNLIHSTAFLLD